MACPKASIAARCFSCSSGFNSRNFVALRLTKSFHLSLTRFISGSAVLALFWSTTVFLVPLTVLFSILGSSVVGILLDGSVSTVRNALLLSGASLVLLAICVMLLRERYSIRTKPEI